MAGQGSDPVPAAGCAVPRPRAPGVTEREIEVAELVASGHANRLIARCLGISEHTVDRHVRSIFAKTNAMSRAELTARLYVAGILDAHAWPPRRHLAAPVEELLTNPFRLGADDRTGIDDGRAPAAAPST